jgi:glycerophosphoryl diester phosphodiesterase
MDVWGRDAVLIVAHRGSSGSAPENTFAAFRKAIDDGADAIELDIRMTKDLELVVLHDRSVNRTTNGSGKISDLTLRELRQLDAGSWFGRSFCDERIPTLSDVIDFLPLHIHLNIEVKTDGEKRKRIDVETALARLLREKSFAHRAIVSSFDHSFLKRFHALAVEVRIGAVYLPVRDFGKKPARLCQKIGATTFVCSRAQLTRRIAQDVTDAGIALSCYGVNTRRDVGKAVKFGARILITDYPKDIRRMAEEAEKPG